MYGSELLHTRAETYESLNEGHGLERVTRLQRKIGDRIASGYALTLDFGVGQLVSDRGKPRFMFDASKLRREEETVVPQSAPVSEEEEEPQPVVEATQTPVVDETEPTASELATTNALLARDGTEAFLAMMPPKS